ncbi:PTS sugar transporter subunit IIB [Lactobacillus sp. ESL0684]|uniref:PTS sugar transporter subunit IIB n=1 Tax=Lactobacillus sp. ESL0684 TaxID=2983213 RepID=UPI0023FA017C|nr:PTS sugar transporter subunit IIB [Lactobacillus sp. ESL0684]WEV44311.1 PTS sugar transporter subunit IIB [Lactobacillus sp. ESL0684]
MAKKTIMLCCSAGMSTSLLVTKMQKAAQAQNMDVEIFAAPASEADNKIAQQPIDCILLGPQVRYMEAEFESKLAETDIALGVIDMQSYGMMDGEKVLQQATELMAK